MAAKYYPKISEIIAKSVLESLSMAHKSATARSFYISEMLDVVPLLDDIESVLKVSAAIFEQEVKVLFGMNDIVNSDVPQCSGSSRSLFCLTKFECIILCFIKIK